MGLTVTFDDPRHAKGKIFAIEGLGRFPNGEEVELTPEQEKEFYDLRGRTVRDALGRNKNVTVGGKSSVRAKHDTSTDDDDNKEEGGDS